jgi:glyoxalase/bleomycin resistance protein/dioxygenase superfamily protein
VTPPQSPFLAPPIRQCAVVVRDLDVAVRRWVQQLGIGPWTGYRLEAPRLRDMRYHGSPAEFSLRHALAWQGELQFELVQPLEGPSIFADHLASHGEGMHHVGKYVLDHAAAVAEAQASGFTCIQSARGFGAEGDGAFAYFDRPDLAITVELIEAPRVRIEPEFVYPREQGG